MTGFEREAKHKWNELTLRIHFCNCLNFDFVSFRFLREEWYQVSVGQALLYCSNDEKWNSMVQFNATPLLYITNVLEYTLHVSQLMVMYMYGYLQNEKYYMQSIRTDTCVYVFIWDICVCMHMRQQTPRLCTGRVFSRKVTVETQLCVGTNFVL